MRREREVRVVHRRSLKLRHLLVRHREQRALMSRTCNRINDFRIASRKAAVEVISASVVEITGMAKRPGRRIVVRVTRVRDGRAPPEITWCPPDMMAEGPPNDPRACKTECG